VQRLHRDARESYEDCYFAVLMLSGKQRMQQDNRQVEIQAGDFAIYDGARPHRLDFDQEWSELVLSIPRPRLTAWYPA
jgi:mannose-6-phosphate isomerase-like protein (cupin superfamily)